MTFNPIKHSLLITYLSKLPSHTLQEQLSNATEPMYVFSIYSRRIILYTAMQPAPFGHSENRAEINCLF